MKLTVVVRLILNMFSVTGDNSVYDDVICVMYPDFTILYCYGVPLVS